MEFCKARAVFYGVRLVALKNRNPSVRTVPFWRRPDAASRKVLGWESEYGQVQHHSDTKHCRSSEPHSCRETIVTEAALCFYSPLNSS